MATSALTPQKSDAMYGDWRPAFIHTLRNTANVRASCAAAGVSRKAAYDAKNSDEAFATEWESAMEDACDILEFVARKRAFETSDLLLIFLLKAHRPERYADRLQVEHVIKKRAQALADKFGMTSDEVVAQAESLLRGNGRH